MKTEKYHLEGSQIVGISKAYHRSPKMIFLK